MGLLEASKKVLISCCVKNGAIVAADTDDPAYPADAKSYRYVWPRDAGYTCHALDILGHQKHSERFYRWCLERAYGVCENGLFWENYHTNGSPNSQSGHMQLDQTGQVLWAMHGTYGGRMPKQRWGKELVTRLAEGLCDAWDGNSFSVACTDLWEERTSYPELGQVFTYSLASCAKGLGCAAELTGNEDYRVTSNSMVEVIKGWKGDILPRRSGDVPDLTVDASILGLAWPHDVLGRDKRVRASVDAIGKVLGKEGGLLRYLGDEYDGWQRGHETYKVGAGTWPLLSLWMALAQANLGRMGKARKWVERVERDFDHLMPEQFLEGAKRSSVTPLCWAHSLYIAAKNIIE